LAVDALLECIEDQHLVLLAILLVLRAHVEARLAGEAVNAAKEMTPRNSLSIRSESRLELLGKAEFGVEISRDSESSTETELTSMPGEAGSSHHIIINTSGRLDHDHDGGDEDDELFWPQKGPSNAQRPSPLYAVNSARRNDGARMHVVAALAASLVARELAEGFGLDMVGASALAAECSAGAPFRDIALAVAPDVVRRLTSMSGSETLRSALVRASVAVFGSDIAYSLHEYDSATACESAAVELCDQAAGSALASGLVGMRCLRIRFFLFLADSPLFR
jgi:hypothetical protein